VWKTAIIIFSGAAIITCSFLFIDHAQVLEPVLVAAVTAVLMALAMYFTVVGPVGSLKESVRSLSLGKSGNITRKKSNGSGSEGQLTDSVSDMAVYLDKAALVAEKIGAGAVPEGYSASKDDRLGVAFEKITGYMNEITAVAKELAAGNFAVDFSPKSDNDSIGQAFFSLINNLKPLINNIKGQSATLSSSSKVFVGIADQLKATAGQLSETMSHISGATAQSASDSQDAAKSALNANQASKKGMELMGRMLSSMSFIRKDMEMSVSQVTELAVYSDRINQMLEVIRAVSEETKLLSFNAAIEAARAGEQGRGFAIVAEEIRKLSDNSAEELKKISVIIRDIRTHMSTLVDNINREAVQIKEGADILEQSNAMFSEIAGAVEMATSKVESIAASSEEIAASAQESAASSQQQTASIEEFSAAGLELENAAKILNETADKFRV
jgi:methyl-accepting chemotaxis protein